MAGVTILGVWVAGGLISDDFRVSMALTAVWFALVGAAVVFGTRGTLRIAAIASYLVTVAAIGGYLLYSTVHDRVVDETVVVAGTAGSELRASGTFVSLAHDAEGTARVVRLAGGEHKLTLTGFSTAAGPDLRVRLVAGRPSDGEGPSNDLGALKGNIGDQQYDVPADVDLARYSTVVIWCRAFSVAFGQAALTSA